MTSWKIVPTQITCEMRIAASAAARDYLEQTGSYSIDVIWQAALAAVPEMPRTEKLLCESALSYEEALRLEAELAPLMRYLGSPGDWGYGTKLGDLTAFLLSLRGQIEQAGKNAILREASNEA